MKQFIALGFSFERASGFKFRVTLISFDIRHLKQLEENWTGKTSGTVFGDGKKLANS